MPPKTPELTPEEKVAGRWFRDQQQALLTRSLQDDPPTHEIPNFIQYFRHECPRQNNRSWSMEMKEVYVFSPEIVVRRDPEGGFLVAALATDSAPEYFEEVQTLPAGRFGFIYKSGKCPCGQTARSPAGRFVDSYVRRPLRERADR